MFPGPAYVLYSMLTVDSSTPDHIRREYRIRNNVAYRICDEHNRNKSDDDGHLTLLYKIIGDGYVTYGLARGWHHSAFHAGPKMVIASCHPVRCVTSEWWPDVPGNRISKENKPPTTLKYYPDDSRLYGQRNIHTKY